MPKGGGNTGLKTACGGLAGTLLFVGFIAIGVLGGPDPSGATENSDSDPVTVVNCGETTTTLVDGFEMIPPAGKLGHEQHLNNGLTGQHYEGPDSNPLTFAAGTGAFAPYTTKEERYYFNTQWGGWNWEPTRTKRAPTLDHRPGADDARNAVKDSKLIITSTETGKSIVVSAQESGPALWVTDRDGVNTGAPPEVYNYLGTSSPYTDNPSDNKGRINVRFATNQNITLGPCGEDT